MQRSACSLTRTLTLPHGYPPNSLTHSLPTSVTHSLTSSITHSRTRSLTHSLTHSTIIHHPLLRLLSQTVSPSLPTYSLTIQHSLHLLTHSHSCTNSLSTCCYTHSRTHALLNSLTHRRTLSFMLPFSIHSLVRLFTH